MLVHAGTLSLEFVAGGKDLSKKSFHFFPIMMLQEPALHLIDSTMSGIAMYLKDCEGALARADIQKIDIVELFE